MSLLILPINRATDANGVALSGAKLYMYLTGTTTPTPVYTTAALTVEHANPVVADAGGLFAAIYLDPAIEYRALIKTSAGVSVPGMDFDPVEAALPTPIDFGVVGDGTTDDTAAWQAYFTACIANDRAIVCDTPMRSKITDTLTIDPAGLSATIVGNLSLNVDLGNVIFEYSGARTKVVLDIGTAPSTSNYVVASLVLPAVIAAGSLVWRTGASDVAVLALTDTAIRLRRLLLCKVDTREIYGFTKGLELQGSANNDISGMNIDDCKFGIVLTSEGADADESYSNENTIGHMRIGATSNVDALGNAYGVVFTWDKTSSYRGQNNNRFHDIDFELGAPAGATYRVPIWFDASGNGNTFKGLRVEVCKGPIGIFDGGGGSRGYANKVEATYISGTGTGAYLLQVNGASGNILTGSGCSQSSWHSGDMGKLIGSNGSTGAYIKGLPFFVNAATPAVTDILKSDSAATNILSHRNGVYVASGGVSRVGVAIDTTFIKDFLCSYDAQTGFPGRACFIALSSTGAILSGNATDATWGNEIYVKATSVIGAQELAAVATTTYAVSADLAAGKSMFVTVRSEVKTLLFMVVGGTAAAVVRGMSVTGYAVPMNAGSVYPTLDGSAGLRVFNPLDDPGDIVLASAKPDTAGLRGYYPRGALVGSTVAASGGAPGWRCTLGGWLCPVWVLSTVYAVPGQIVTNDTGKVYELTTAGTSAGAGGPTGTTATWDGITDNTAKWRYIGVLATFSAEANLA